jgi:hypothetical protein
MCLDSKYGEEILGLCNRIKVLLDKKSGFEEFYEKNSDRWYIDCWRFNYAEDNIEKLPFLLFGEIGNLIYKTEPDCKLKLKGLCLAPYNSEVSQQFVEQFFKLAGVLYIESHRYAYPCQVNTIGISKIVKKDTSKEFFYVYAFFLKTYYTNSQESLS